MSEHRTLNTCFGETLTVRRLQSGDGEKLQRFHENLSEVSRGSFTPHAYDSETIRRYVRRSESDEDRVYVLQTSAGEIVGYFFLWEFQMPIPLLGT